MEALPFPYSGKNGEVNMADSITGILSLLILIGVGFCIAGKEWFGEKGRDVVSKFCVRLAIPCYMFCNVLSACESREKPVSYTHLDVYKRQGSIHWLTNEKIALFSVMGIDIWKGLGVATLILSLIHIFAYRVAKMNATYEEVAKQAEMTLDEYLQANAGMNLDEFNSQLTLTLRNSLVSELILKAIAESEEMTVSEDEYQKALEEIAANANVTTDDVIERYGRTTIETNVLTNKAIQFLQDNTTFVEGKPEESTEAATEARCV